jgi:hypothetical protein
MGRAIRIDPITRLEGHGRIEIFLDDGGNVANAYFQVPELRGFERFCVGRAAEEMPVITNRICGVCPEAHHMAAAKALDGVFGVEPPRPRESCGNWFTPPSSSLTTSPISTPWAARISWWGRMRRQPSAIWPE